MFLLSKAITRCRPIYVQSRSRSPRHLSLLFFGGRAPGILFQDFIYNRTDGSPQDIFKKLGDTATSYLKTHEMGTPRASNVSEELPKDHILSIEDLTLDKIKLLTSQSILKKT